MTSAKLTIALCIVLLAFSPPAFAQDDELVIEEVEEVKAKENRYDKTKWEKRKYGRFLERRKRNGLPEQLNLVGDSVLARDPALRQSNITSTIDLPETKTELTEKLAVYVEMFPEALPDTNLLFNDANIKNAIAVDTGQIVIPAGIINDLKSEDAIMFVLGHELAHIAMDHFKAKETKKSLDQMSVVVAMAASDFDSNKAASRDELVGYMIFSEAILGAGWSKANERSADELGIDLMVRAGYSLEEARSVVLALVLEEKEKQRDLERKCGGNPNSFGNIFAAAFTGQQVQNRPPECQQQGGGGLLGGLFKGKTDPDKRLLNFDKYVESRYPAYESPAPTPFTGVIKRDFAPDGSLRRAVYAGQSIQALERGRYELAAQYAVASLKQGDTTLIKPRLAMYDLYKRAGRRDEALAQLNIALASDQASRAVYTFAISERVNDARGLVTREREAYYDRILTDVLARYGEDGLAALADAEASQKAFDEDDDGYWSRGEAPPSFSPEDIELSPEAVTAYEDVLELSRAAQERFPGVAEFLLAEVDTLKTLKRTDELIERLSGCQRESDDKTIKETCAAIQQQLAEPSA